MRCSRPGKGAARKLSHARILLKADAARGGPGWTDAAISEGVDVGTATVERVANLFINFEPLAGKRRVKVTERRTKEDRAECIREMVDETYPEAERIVLVMDNLNTHTPASLYEAFPPDEAKRIADRLEIHYTPKHGSRLDMAEIELGILGH